MGRRLSGRIKKANPAIQPTFRADRALSQLGIQCGHPLQRNDISSHSPIYTQTALSSVNHRGYSIPIHSGQV